jgi:pyruvate/2-oxoglutarate/acetoin dehydrogenase E1 component
MTANEKIISTAAEPVEQTRHEITYREAIVAALREEMRRDPKTLIMGEDIGESGGPFKTCQGLYEEFGAARVRDTPIAETGFVGAALGSR